MRAITIQQPWAWAIAYGGKRIENRVQASPCSHVQQVVGKRVAIHAGLRVDHMGLRAGGGMWPSRDSMPLGCVVAVATVIGASDDRQTLVELAGVEDQVDAWYLDGNVGIVLGRVTALPNPVPCRGMLGWWRVPEMVEFDINANLGRILASRLADGSYSGLTKTDP